MTLDVGGPRLWRVGAMDRKTCDAYIVVAPGRDVYAEELGLLSEPPDISNIRVRGWSWGLFLQEVWWVRLLPAGLGVE